MTSTADYHETPYEDATYEIVGPPPSENTFVPLKIMATNSAHVHTDPMFQDFGGNREEGDALWHLPHSAKYISEDKKKSDEERRARREAEQQARVQEAYQKGLAEGVGEARAEAEAEMNEKLKQMHQVLSSLFEDYKTQLDEKIIAIEKEAVSFAVHLTEKIIPDAVEINPEYIVPLVQEALHLSGGAIIKQIRVSPADLEFITVVGLAKSIKEFDGTWDFVGDETIRAGCIVDTSAGEVEYDLNKAWDRVKHKVLSVVK